MKELQTIFPVEVTQRVILSSLNARATIEMNGTTYVPDAYSCYVEFRLAHAFPVVTIDGLALHPQVVANSFPSLKHKVFNFGHIMKSYNADENHRDRILGTIVDVEFPRAPFGTGWQVGEARASAPGIRAVAVMHKQAEGVDKVIGQFKSGRKRWTVSRENDYFLEDSGFLVRHLRGVKEASPWSAQTPDDLARHGDYIPCVDAPDELLECYDPKSGRIRRTWNGRPVVLLVGGLGTPIQFKGTGLTPLGKEEEARILDLAASHCSGEAAQAFLDDDEAPPDLSALSPLKSFLEFSRQHIVNTAPEV